MKLKMPKNRNSFAGILKRQKFIIIQINNPDGTTETRRERNPDYQWNLFNSPIKLMLHFRARKIRKKLKQFSSPYRRG
jgi:hypothetical protein